MAWPDNLAEVSTNLPKDEFTVVKFAIDCDLVEWGEGSLMMELGTCPFTFNGQKYELSEIYELVSSLNRKE